MQKLLYILLSCFFLAIALPTFASTVFVANQGGTGTSTPSGILYGDNGATNHLNSVTIGSGCTFTAGTLSCPGTGGGSSFGYLFPANATSTLITFNNGLTVNGNLSANTAVFSPSYLDTSGLYGMLVDSTQLTLDTKSGNAITLEDSSGKAANIILTSLTGTKSFTLPNTSGTFCLTSTCAAFSYPFPANATSTNITFSGGLTGTLTGNASTATTLATGRTLSITGDLSYTSPTFDGSGNVTAAGTLATVNGNVGSFTYANITVNGKGLITAASNGTAPVTSVSGTANQITSSGGTTPTLSLPNHVIFPIDFLATNSSTTNATTTGNAYFTGITASRPLYIDSTGKLTSAGTGTSGDCVNWGANNTLGDAGSACGSGGGSGGGTFSTTTSQVVGELINHPNNNTDVVVVGASATTSAPFFIDPNSTTGPFFAVGSSSPFASLSIHLNPTDSSLQTIAFAIGSSTATATTTLFSVGNQGSTTIGLFGACSGTNALTTNAAGTIACGAITGSGGGIGDPFTHPFAGASATTSLMLLFGNASTTQLSAGLATFGQTASSTFGADGSLQTPIGTATVHIATTTNDLSRGIGLTIGTTTWQGAGQSGQYIASTSPATTNYTIDWNKGNVQRLILTGNSTADVNATSSHPIDGGFYGLKVCQDPTGSRTFTFPDPIPLRWPTLGATPGATTTISSAANSCTYIGMQYDALNSIYSVLGSTTGVSIR